MGDAYEAMDALTPTDWRAEARRLRAEVARLRALLDPDNEALVDRLARVVVDARAIAMRPGFTSPELEPIPVTQVRAVLAALRERAS